MCILRPFGTLLKIYLQGHFVLVGGCDPAYTLETWAVLIVLDAQDTYDDSVVSLNNDMLVKAIRSLSARFNIFVLGEYNRLNIGTQLNRYLTDNVTSPSFQTTLQQVLCIKLD